MWAGFVIACFFKLGAELDVCGLPELMLYFHIFPKMELTVQQNHFKIELKRLEDDLLNRLSAARGHFLGDVSLVEQLENTKTTATHIQRKVKATDALSVVPLCSSTRVVFLSLKCFMNVT